MRFLKISKHVLMLSKHVVLSIVRFLKLSKHVLILSKRVIPSRETGEISPAFLTCSVTDKSVLMFNMALFISCVFNIACVQGTAFIF